MQSDTQPWAIEKAFHYENGYFLTGDVSRIGKLLAHYELYREITDLPGDIFEFGVFKGASLVRWLSFRHMLEAQLSRKVIGFDTFDTFPIQDIAEDQAFVEGFTQEAGKPLSKETLEYYFSNKGFNNYELVAGDILKTLPEYLEKHPEKRAAMVHIDVDVYEPTKAILKEIYDKIVPGGLIVLDDYAKVAGETNAVDEFIKDKQLKIEKLPLNVIPAFIRKP